MLYLLYSYKGTHADAEVYAALALHTISDARLGVVGTTFMAVASSSAPLAATAAAVLSLLALLVHKVHVLQLRLWRLQAAVHPSPRLRYSVCLLYLFFAGTKVQILTPKEASRTVKRAS
jgi:hypothetical protein